MRRRGTPNSSALTVSVPEGKPETCSCNVCLSGTAMVASSRAKAVTVHRRAASGDDAELLDRHRQEVLHEQPRPQPQQKLFQGRAPQSLAGMRRLKNAPPPPQVLEGKRKRHASTWLMEFVKVVLLPGPGTVAPLLECLVV